MRCGPQELLELVYTDGAKGVVVHVQLLDRLVRKRGHERPYRWWQRFLTPRHEHIAKVSVPELLTRSLTDQIGDILAASRVVRVAEAFNLIEAVRTDPFHISPNKLDQVAAVVEEFLLGSNPELLIVFHLVLGVTATRLVSLVSQGCIFVATHLLRQVVFRLVC